MLAMWRCSAMIRLMETHTFTDPDINEADLVNGLYHAAKLNPDFTFAGMSGRELSIMAVQTMQQRNMPEAEDLKIAEARSAFDDFYNTGTHESLGYAVSIARDFLGYEELSQAWYAREDVEEIIRRDTTCEIAEFSRASVAARYQNDDEFEMALLMTQKGFEGTEESIALFAALRFESALWHMVPVSTKKAPYLRDLLSIEELRAFGHRSNVRLAYDAVVSMSTRISAVSDSEELRSLSRRLVEGVTGAALDVVMTDGRSDSRLLAAELLPAMLEIDPQNTRYKKWQKKLRRHFKFAELTTLPGISLNSYTPGEIESALHSLGELTRNDVLNIMAEHITRNTTVDGDNF